MFFSGILIFSDLTEEVVNVLGLETGEDYLGGFQDLRGYRSASVHHVTRWFDNLRFLLWKVFKLNRWNQEPRCSVHLLSDT